MVEVSANQLRVLSLEEVTERLGEPGLRERFWFEIYRFADDERALLEGALELATMLHEGEQRVREPYINHVLRVALRVLSDPEYRDVEVVAAAILHDTVENHYNTLLEDGELEGLETEMLHALALDTLQAMFNQRIAVLTAILTNQPVAPDMPQAQRHQLYRDNVIEKLIDHPDARVIKACDVIDNTADLEALYAKNPEKAVSLARKYEPLLLALAELIAREDTPLSDATKAAILEQLRQSRERCRAIIDLLY